MRAAVYDEFRGPLRVAELPDPVAARDGAVIQVHASGLCRSDWHGWQGHDPDIRNLPHIPGHELAGVVVEVGSEVQNWRGGERVTIPFVGGCGRCVECQSGNHQVCDHQYQPGFTGWGSFAQLVAVRYADANLVQLPAEMDFVTAASLGCRFATAYRGVAVQGNVASGDWVVVHGCGGVGLSAVMIASALGARVIGVDIHREALELAESLGATEVIDAAEVHDVPQGVHESTVRGADVSLDAFGSHATCSNSIRSLRKRGRHIQLGLLAGDQRAPPTPMDLVVARELQIRGSHGLQAHCYPEMLTLITEKGLDPQRLIARVISLDDVPQALIDLGGYRFQGITVVDRF